MGKSSRISNRSLFRERDVIINEIEQDIRTINQNTYDYEAPDPLDLPSNWDSYDRMEYNFPRLRDIENTLKKRGQKFTRAEPELQKIPLRSYDDVRYYEGD